jgi:hypothetical protein
MAAPGRKGLTKRELNRLKRVWTTAVRELIKRLPLPAHASMEDALALFAAVLEEVKVGRKIIDALRKA